MEKRSVAYVANRKTANCKKHLDGSNKERDPMWEQYKRTLPLMQLTIWTVTFAIYFTMNHLVLLAAIFFVAMQVSSVFGAMWAFRLKGKVSR